jgi:hypothetical protein
VVATIVAVGISDLADNAISEIDRDDDNGTETIVTVCTAAAVDEIPSFDIVDESTTEGTVVAAAVVAADIVAVVATVVVVVVAVVVVVVVAAVVAAVDVAVVAAIVVAVVVVVVGVGSFVFVNVNGVVPNNEDELTNVAWEVLLDKEDDVVLSARDKVPGVLFGEMPGVVLVGVGDGVGATQHTPALVTCLTTVPLPSVS